MREIDNLAIEISGDSIIACVNQPTLRQVAWTPGKKSSIRLKA